MANQPSKGVAKAKLSQVSSEEIRTLRRANKLHARVTSELIEALHLLFPEWVCISEINQTPGGRNDAVLFECGGNSICFEVFATKSQVDRDLLLLYNSPANRKVAILIDREVDSSIADAYYRKQPHQPFPAIWISDVIDKQRRSFLRLKLTQFVLGGRVAEYIVISRQLAQTAQDRIFQSWQDNGIDIYSGAAGNSPSLPGVYALLTVKHLRALGMPLEKCEGAARCVNDNFDYIIRQTLIGVPMYLVRQQKEYSLLDFTDYEAWQVGLVLRGQADYVTVLLNTLYDELKGAYKGELPEAGDMSQIIRLIR